MTKLEKFRVKEKMTYRGLAEFLGLDHTTVYKYCKGQRKPQLEMAIKIEDKTKGKVGIRDWK